jgi:hypothetical protein
MSDPSTYVAFEPDEGQGDGIGARVSLRPVNQPGRTGPRAMTIFGHHP